MTQMTTMHIYGKEPSEYFPPGTKSLMTVGLTFRIGDVSFTHFFSLQNMILGGP